MKDVRTTAVCIVSFLLLAGCGRGASPGTTPIDAAHPTGLLALGDSYTIGQSVPEAVRWPVQLAARLKQRGLDVGDPTIIAQTGWAVADLSEGIDRADPHGPYRLVGLLIGVNDQFRGGTAEGYRPQFVAMLRRAIGFAGGDAKRVFVLSIPDWGVMPFADGQDRAAIGGAIDAFNAVDRDECAKAGVGFIDVTPVSRQAATQPALGAPDGLHPSGTQYARWAALADAALRTAGQ